MQAWLEEIKWQQTIDEEKEIAACCSLPLEQVLAIKKELSQTSC